KLKTLINTDFAIALKTAEIVAVPYGKVYFLGYPDLIDEKLRAKRPKDLIDIKQLREIRGEQTFLSARIPQLQCNIGPGLKSAENFIRSLIRFKYQFSFGTKNVAYINAQLEFLGGAERPVCIEVQTMKRNRKHIRFFSDSYKGERFALHIVV